MNSYKSRLYSIGQLLGVRRVKWLDLLPHPVTDCGGCSEAQLSLVGDEAAEVGIR
jgi:hypothetical protein